MRAEERNEKGGDGRLWPDILAEPDTNPVKAKNGGMQAACGAQPDPCGEKGVG